MGATNSADLKIRAAPFEGMLDRLSYLSLELVSFELRKRIFANDFGLKEMYILATRIYEYATVERTDLCSRYVELASSLSDISFEDRRKGKKTFKDVFLQYSILEFENLRSPHPAHGSEKVNLYAQLLNSGLASATLVLHWLDALNRHPILRNEMLMRMRLNANLTKQENLILKEMVDDACSEYARLANS